MITELFSSLLSISFSLLGITFIVVFHEFGHFLFAKLFNVYAPTFSIGIGKKLFSKKIGDTDFCISAGPIGGYVEIATEKGKPGTLGFDEIPYWQKFLITLGGIFFNIILTYLLFSLIFFVGAPESPMLPYNRNTTTVASTREDSPNAQALEAGDQFISINKTAVEDARTLLQELRTAQSEELTTVQAKVLRNEKTKTVRLQLDTNKKNYSIKQFLHIDLEKKAPLSLLESLKQGYATTNLYISATCKSLASIFSGKNLNNFSGPIMMIAIGSKSAKKGFSSLLLLLAIISINLAIMNLLPLPIFDGGQIVIFTIEAIIGKKLSERVQNAIGTSSWFLIIGLLILFSLKDIYTLFESYIQKIISIFA